MATPVPPTLERSYTFLYAYLMEPSGVQSPSRSSHDLVSSEDLTRWVRAEDVACIVDQVHAGRAARELICATEKRAESLRSFCQNTIFHSYLPKEARTASLCEVFETRYHRLDPETKIAIYEKWLAELPYHQFTHLTSMTIYPKTERGLFVLPPEIGNFSHLTKLSFSDWLQSLPETLKRLPSLKTLDLRFYSGGNRDLENFKDICRALPRLEKIVFSDTFRQPEYTEMLQRDFPNIKVELEAIPEAPWHPC